MPRSYRKVNVGSGVGFMGKVSCVGLLLMMFLLANPFVGFLAFAEGDDLTGSEYSDNVGTEYGNDGADEGYGGNAADSDSLVTADNSTDSGIMTLAGVTTSSVGISFSPAMYYASLSPTTSTGQSARIDLTATVSIYNSGGYSVYLKSNNGANLVGTKSSSNTIPSMGTTTATYANIPVNTWGYTSTEGTSVPNTAVYKAIATSGNGDEVAKNNTGDNIDYDSKTIALSFATKINNEKPADTYSNTMTLSVVSSPMKVVEIAYDYGGITNMQQMTTAICNAAPIGGIKQLKDTRDNKYYWIAKLEDGHCWMTQNLDLDLSTSTTLTTTTSDVTANWTPGYTTATTASSSTILANDTGQRSWSLGNYRITNPDTASDCGSAKNSAANCTSQFTAYTTPTSANGETDAHYILGNHYQWCAATAGCKNSSNQTGSSFTSGEAVSSICPKGWRLPTSGDDGEFQALVTSLGGTSSTNNLTKPLFYAVRSGAVLQDASYLFGDAGNGGRYWSSTAYDSLESYNLNFNGISNVIPSIHYTRQRGYSVRCVAR